MNKERILLLADHIEEQPHTHVGSDSGFTMSTFQHSCGTPACLAGHAAAMSLGMEAEDNLDHVNVVKAAEDWLELGYSESVSLFLPTGIKLSHITPEHAAATLRHFAETGKVVWPNGLEITS